jgi:hypothetical protein
LGEDEKQLLDALHGRGALGEKLKKDLEADKEKAKYKIELQFAAARSAKLEVPNLFQVMVWESGRRFHGGGDQRMVFCGYWRGQGYPDKEECMKPIADSNFAVNHLVCPHCGREQFLDPQVKARHIEIAREERSDVAGLERMPIVNPTLVGKLSAQPMSRLLARIFRDCGSAADLYIKFHATDIRCRDVAEVKKADHYRKAREDRVEKKENRGLLIYPLKNIIKDTVSGKPLEKCFLGCLLS